MTEAQLKSRCEALASVGDEQAKATLIALGELEERRAKTTPQASDSQKANLANAMYVLNKIEDAVKLAKDLRLQLTNIAKKQAEETKKTGQPSEFVGVRVNGATLDGIEPKPPANIPLAPKYAEENTIRNLRLANTDAEQLARIEEVAKEFGISTHEATAVDATRQAHGLAPTSESGVTAAASNVKSAKERVPNAGDEQS